MNSLKNPINPLCVNIIFMKKIAFSKIQNKIVRRVALFHIFANLFTMWLNRKQLHSHICFGIQSVVLSQVIKFLENSTMHS